MSDEDDPFRVLTRSLFNGLELKQFSSNHDFSEGRERELYLKHSSLVTLILAPGLYKE